MIDSKEATSNVEEKRERFEEPIRTVGSAIRSERIWRDSVNIPTKAPKVDTSIMENNTDIKSVHAITTRNGASIINVADYYYKLQLERVPGTINCYSSSYLKNVITAELFGDYYNPTLYIDDNQLAFGVGNPLYDVAAGTVYFNDKEFAEKIKGKTLSISFFKYVGRTGTGNNNDLPFVDNIKHLKNAEDDNATATFKVRGESKNTNYILPSETGGWYDKGDAEDTGVVLLQENLEDALWEGDVKISGGEWVELNGLVKTYKYDTKN